jgi:hypothetical protein
MLLTCQQLLETYRDEWYSANHHSFLQHCKFGAIQPAQFYPGWCRIICLSLNSPVWLGAHWLLRPSPIVIRFW